MKVKTVLKTYTKQLPTNLGVRGRLPVWWFSKAFFLLFVSGLLPALIYLLMKIEALALIVPLDRLFSSADFAV